MSNDISLKDPVTKEDITFDDKHQIKGGTYAMGGSQKAWLNITYNYSSIFRKLLGGDNAKLSSYDKMFGGGETGIRLLYGKSGAEAIPILEKAISKLKDDINDDYWKATEGNAKRALYGLLAFAKMRPDGIFDGD